MMNDEAARAEIAARIERLPLTRWHLKSLTFMGTAHFFDAFDSLVIAFVLPVLVLLWHMTPAQVGATVAAGSVGQVVGALAISAYAERSGRVKALRVALAMISLSSLAAALSNSLGIFQLIRIVQGIGLGGETPVGATYINEIAPLKNRGRLVFALESVFALGIVLVSVVALFVIPNLGWRAMFVIGGLPLILAILLPRIVEESPRWLAFKGRFDEASAILGRVEATVPDLAVPQPHIITNVPRRARLSELISRRHVGTTMVLSTVALCTALVGYGISIWMPTLYTTVYHLPLRQALGYSMLPTFASLVGGGVGAWLVERIGRRATFILGFLGAAVTMSILVMVGFASVMNVVIASTVSTGFMSFLLFGIYAYAPELYPTEIRAMGAGSASACLRVGAIFGPIVTGLLLQTLGIKAIFLFFAVVAAIGAAVMWIWGPETRGRPLDQLTAEG